MRIEFQGRNEEITQGFRNHAEPRLSTLAKHLPKLTDIRVTLAAQKGSRIVEITADLDGQVFRSEERAHDEMTAFDKAAHRVERQMLRSKARHMESHRQPVRTDDVPAAEAESAEEHEPISLEDITIVRTKSHALKPMTPEEAVLQMEQVHHDFFVFINGTTESVAVVYRRKDGGYGLIEPETE
jgi:putative sigma-54 modulation protein